MKLAFTSLGCPDWNWEHMLEQAVSLGYQGIELRGVDGEMHLPAARPFLPENLRGTKDRLEELGLTIPCLGTSSRFDDSSTLVANIEQAKAHIDLAEALGTPFIRVFGDRIPDKRHREQTIAQIAGALQELGEYARGTRVKVLIETHGDFSRSDDLLSVLDQVSSPAVGVLWDVHHPYRLFGEDPKLTFSRIRPYICHTHFKDSQVVEGGFAYCLLGEGDTPIPTILQLLQQMDYQGWYTLEWEKKWHPEIAEPEVVFPHYVSAMQALSQR